MTCPIPGPPPSLFFKHLLALQPNSKLRFYMATEEKTSPIRLGHRGNIKRLSGGCNKTAGKEGLERFAVGPPTQWINQNGKSTLDIQINTQKFVEHMQSGVENTMEMAAKWGWHHNDKELNWRDTPVDIRLHYDKKSNKFRVQVWNELIQIWAYLDLSKEDVLKIIEG